MVDSHNERRLHLRRLIATAVFLAIYLIFRSQAVYLPLFGSNDVRIGVHGVFVILPAILFGPWYGAAASGLGDLLGHFAFPIGAWLWQITVIMICAGFIRGWVWRLLRARSPIGTRAVVVVMTLAFFILGAVGAIQLRQDGITRHFYEDVAEPSAVDTSGMSYMGRLVVSRTQNTSDPGRFALARIIEVTFAPLGAGLLGVLLLVVDVVLSRGLRKEDAESGVLGDSEIGKKGWFAPWNGSVMPLALTVIVVSLMINSANSWLFWAVTVPAWREFPFMYIWLPRALIALLNSVVNVFIAVLLLRVCNRLPHIRKLMQ